MQCSLLSNTNFNRFSPGDTNLVLREFEKCGVVLKHIPGPRNANWMHILYQVSSSGVTLYYCLCDVKNASLSGYFVPPPDSCY